MSYPVPHLTTALSGPLQKLEQHFLTHQVKIETWLREQMQLTPPPFYCSVDLRNAGFKIAPVDTNLFPGGFNNLNPEFMPLCIQAVQASMDKVCKKNVCRVLLIPENHTRNLPYFDNIIMIRDILEKAGYEVRIGSLIDSLTSAKTIPLASGRELTLEPLTRKGNRLMLDGFDPCLILLNNDLSEGVPSILNDLEQEILPPLNSGWATRLKSVHFHHYQNVCREFGEHIGLDPWLITPTFRFCRDLDFMTHEGENCLVKNTTAVLQDIQRKYDELGINEKPFVVIKSDFGTYGMSVMSVQDPAEISQLNRKQRSRMAAAKGGKPVSSAIIQEGVYSYETLGDNNAVAEPVVYMIGRHVVGGFYRVHEGRGPTENLNAPGMNFQPLAFADCCNNPGEHQPESVNRFYTYGVIARLALVASAREIA